MQDNPQIITLEQLIDLAKQAEYTAPIEWGELPIDEDYVYSVYAKAVYLAFSKTAPENRNIVYLASLIKLNVENFALQQTNLQLQKTIANLQKNRG